MMRIEKRVRDYLASIGQLDYVGQGSKRTVQDVPRERNEAFVLALRADLRRTDFVLALAVLLLVLFSVAFLALAIRQIKSPATAGALVAGHMGSLLVFFWPLRQLWIERTLIGMLVAIIPDLAPTEGAAAISALYEKLRKKQF